MLWRCSGKDVGEALITDKRTELVSFTGSTKVGRHVNEVVARRFGKTILELGGNNAMIVDKDADLEMALRATLFSAVGTAGQRCTSLRRLFLHEDIHDEFLNRLVSAYKNVKIGSPLEDGVLCGPLHNTQVRHCGDCRDSHSSCVCVCVSRVLKLPILSVMMSRR